MSLLKNVAYCYEYSPRDMDQVSIMRAVVVPSLRAMRRDRILNAAFMRHDKNSRAKVKVLRFEAKIIKLAIDTGILRQYYKTAEFQ
tara:strand:- start:14438 stop:14695 length:258 start_codon:yes stop_codon:yes gene_type:complete